MALVAYHPALTPRCRHGLSSPDFEAGVVGQSAATTGEVNPDLDADGKPVFSGLATAHITNTITFAEWYRTDTSRKPINHATASKLALWKNADGNYVNRYGPNGEQWNITQNAYWCGTVGQGKTDANGNEIPCTFAQGTTDCDKMDSQGYTQLRCFTDSAGTTYQALYSVGKVDGNPLFFPIDNDPFSANELTGAQVPSTPAGLYDASGTWPWDLDANGKKLPPARVSVGMRCTSSGNGEAYSYQLVQSTCPSSKW
jgi:hypothetical protein